MTQHYLPRITRGLRDGWSKTCLIAITYIASTSLAWSQTAQNTEEPGIVLDARALPYLAGLILAHAAVPLIKYHWSSKVSRKAYKAYLFKSVESAKIRFDAEHEHTPEKIRKEHPEVVDPHDDWLVLLEKNHSGVPQLLLMMAQAISKRNSENGDNQKYIPFISYAGMPTSEINHEHPIWLFSKRDNSIISKYLLSELQVERSITDLYGKHLLELATSEDPKKRVRWTSAAFMLLEDLAEHYVNMLELERHLNGRRLFDTTSPKEKSPESDLNQ